MSLTESCIAAAVVSTVMAIAAPSLMRVRENYILQSAARDVATKMHATRVSAVARDRDCRMAVASAVSYVIECQEASAWQVVDRVSLPEGVTVTANGRPEFHRRGNVSPTATFAVWNRTGRSVRIVVNVNGRVRVQ